MQEKFKNNLKKIWKIVWKIIQIFFVIILIILVFIGIYYLHEKIEKQKAQKIVPEIHNQKLTIDDVMGKHLPPKPNAQLNNSTLEGVDFNKNGIRDDVELAIFKLYPDSARIRSGALQYAKAMQMHFRKDITNDDIFIAILQEKSRGGSCFYHILPKIDFNLSEKEINEAFRIKDKKKEEIYDLVFNTAVRKNKENENYEKYSIIYSNIKKSNCVIDPITLPN